MEPIHFAAVLGVNPGMANITPPRRASFISGCTGNQYDHKRNDKTHHDYDLVRMVADFDDHRICARDSALVAGTNIQSLIGLSLSSHLWGKAKNQTC